MNIDLEYSFKNINLNDITDFENKYGISFAKDYKNFLLMNNGGKTSKRRRFKTNDENRDGIITSSILLFFPLSNEINENLENKYKLFNINKIIPSNFLPIGEDPRKNLVCISLYGDDEGSVYHCEMDYNDYLKEQIQLEENHIRLIAKSFTEFIDRLFIPEV
ncbi:SMI1/KNR4 family protein [Clostridium beijerinckii]|uniref:Knr4/Smi1-like domain-containing protein n=1 Tax=Clostridium beijerinckii TaxID=1520 RepID=A0AAE5LNS3_CLOBE|nr:SMI1/KNR4 family protein [Clostridium beijerinckii]ALB44454.1 SMI1/KNR4 family protein [Clostridium beijerinckii NRRL B-598]NSB12867.1 hypothetical protein [Clostridium beijerinckii]OOM19320.1 SMI1 / KNR4 family protein [Clostridium beijerinckii]